MIYGTPAIDEETGEPDTSICDAHQVEYFVPSGCPDCADDDREQDARFEASRERCESGWTGDRCSFPLFHAGQHSNA